MEKILSNILKTTNVTMLTKAILKSSYRDVQVTSKWKTLEKPVCFLRAVGFWPTFEWHNFGHILGNVPKLHFLENQHMSLKTRPH